ncbi:hypothetical protein PHLCEN_2v7805 [Hermanssonia centrifuga]|uniref:RFTS domain-containing protein n=1 Tax=Hermanssonia centrifuga TaxID=98765 RepID=A0A2R6NVP7_9APHY|nr:hypothetical protein PHLCEN_2v7805 [Hermanssonia centrifuga]
MTRIQQPVSASVPTSAVGRSEESSERSEQDEYYESLDDEVVEDAQLNVYKETNIEQDEGESDSGGADRDVPIRVLTAFTIYERDTSRLIPIETLLESADLKGYEYCASGRVHAWVDDDDTDYDDEDDEDDDEDETIQTDDLSANAQMVSLSQIIEVNVHHVPDGSEGSRNFNLDSKIYIRTKFAWYILRIPAKDYLLYYSPFWIKQQLFHQLLTSTFENRRLTYATFLETLEECEASDLADAIIGHRLGEEHFTCEETEAYIISTFNDLCEDYTHLRSLRKTPIFTDIFKSDLKPSSRSKSKVKPRLKDIEKNRQVELKTIVTRKVYAVAKKLFPTKLFVVVGADLMDGIEESVDVSRHQTHKLINEIQWDRDTRVVPDHYRVVLVDGVRYEAST